MSSQNKALKSQQQMANYISDTESIQSERSLRLVQRLKNSLNPNKNGPFARTQNTSVRSSIEGRVSKPGPKPVKGKQSFLNSTNNSTMSKKNKDKASESSTTRDKSIKEILKLNRHQRPQTAKTDASPKPSRLNQKKFKYSESKLERDSSRNSQTSF
jgi:hypothetical protein